MDEIRRALANAVANKNTRTLPPTGRSDLIATQRAHAFRTACKDMLASEAELSVHIEQALATFQQHWHSDWEAGEAHVRLLNKANTVVAACRTAQNAHAATMAYRAFEAARDEEALSTTIAQATERGVRNLVFLCMMRLNE